MTVPSFPFFMTELRIPVAVFRGTLAHFFLNTSFQRLNGPWLLLSDFSLHDTPYTVGDRYGLQAGESSTHTLCLWSRTVVSHAERGMALSCWNNHLPPRKRCLLDGSICLSKIPIHASISMVPSHINHDRSWILQLSLIAAEPRIHLNTSLYNTVSGYISACTAWTVSSGSGFTR